MLWIDLKHYHVKENADKIILYYTMEEEFIEKLHRFEKSLLERFNQSIQKKIQPSSYETKQIFYGNTKLEQFKLYLRISGVWESDTHIGITSKVDVYPST